MPRIEATITADLDDGFMNDFLDTVADAVNYWGGTSTLERHPSKDNWASVKSLEVEEYEASEAGEPKRFVMDEAAVILGIKRVIEKKADGEYMTNDAHRDSILKAVMENDMANMDVWDIDCVVQAAMFNDIVYG